MNEDIQEERSAEVTILGTTYRIRERSKEEDGNLESCDGYCDWSAKEIVVRREIEGTLGNMERYINKVLRHEITHAFLIESGLAESSGETEAWAMNETMVDWIARQGVKLMQAWREAGALE